MDIQAQTMSQIKVTLETLYDMLRNEKKREDLQELDRSFFVDVVSYLREKQALLETKSENDELFAAGERDKIDYELRSIKRILKELYEKREKKIIDIALNKSRTRSDIIDTSAMLPEEKMFYTDILKTLDRSRHGVLLNLFRAQLPMLEQETTVSKDPVTPEVDGKMKCKFIHPTPSFVWRDMKEYGPFDSGEEEMLDSALVALLVRKGRARRV